MAILTERGLWANATVTERGKRVFANGLDERGRRVFGLSAGSGTTYSGSGTATGAAAVTSGEHYIYTTNGTASGVGSASSNEHYIYTASGTSQGTASASSSDKVIYQGSGTASGIASPTSTEVYIYTASGTASGIGSATGTAIGPTTYPSSGTASGIANVISRDILLSSRGTTLKRAYVFQGSNSLVATQVDINFKTLFDYLGSQIIGINMNVSSGAASVSVTGLTQTDAQYAVTVIPSWNTTYWITGKTTSGFTINFGTSPGSNTTLDWRLMR